MLDLVFIALCATIAGAQNYHQVETFARQRRDWLSKYCHFPTQGSLSHDTFERLFRRRDSRRFARWTQALSDGFGLKQIAIDEKTLRGSGPSDSRPLHVVSAWATENRLCFGQEAVDEKSTEITAIPNLLKLLDLRGALVTIDAMGCQKAIAKPIVDRGGDYVLPVKENQEKWLREIKTSFNGAAALEFEGIPHDIYIDESEGHGRIERRTYIIMKQLKLVKEREHWDKLSVIGWCFYEREVKGSVSIEDHYFISGRDMDANGYGAALRGHWGIENQCHWQLGVTFGEDSNRVTNINAAQNLSVLRRMAVGLLQ